jgi:hypothetical protein
VQQRNLGALSNSNDEAKPKSTGPHGHRSPSTEQGWLRLPAFRRESEAGRRVELMPAASYSMSETADGCPATHASVA